MNREESESLHRLSLKYSEDCSKIKTSMTVVKLGFIQNIVKEFLRSRICENCTYCVYYKDYATCSNDENMQEIHNSVDMQITLDFGCNKFEPKNAN